MTTSKITKECRVVFTRYKFTYRQEGRTSSWNSWNGDIIIQTNNHDLFNREFDRPDFFILPEEFILMIIHAEKYMSVRKEKVTTMLFPFLSNIIGSDLTRSLITNFIYYHDAANHDS